MRIKQNPYHLLLLTGLVLVLAPLFLRQGKTMDIHVRDTYYVMAQGHLYMLLAFVLWILWAFYLATRNLLYSTALTWVHLMVTFLTVLLVLLLLNTGNGSFNTGPTHDPDRGIGEVFMSDPDTAWMASTIFALLWGQLIFVMNLIVGIVKRGT